MMRLVAAARSLWQAERLSPKDLVRRAAVFCALFGAAHLFGLRAYTTVLSGSRADPALSLGVEAVLGSTYLVLYFLVVVVVPVLLIAAALALLLGRIFAGPPG